MNHMTQTFQYISSNLIAHIREKTYFAVIFQLQGCTIHDILVHSLQFFLKKKKLFPHLLICGNTNSEFNEY